ncbi:hypothetical protein [Nocardia tenerifensis]|nr:hypothetical protein [Nocardia tenerifensis]
MANRRRLAAIRLLGIACLSASVRLWGTVALLAGIRLPTDI